MLDENGSLETGLKFDNTYEVRFFFVIRTAACFGAAGTYPELKLECIRARTVGRTVPNTFKEAGGGMLSEGQFVGRRCLTVSESKVKDVGSK